MITTGKCYHGAKTVRSLLGRHCGLYTRPVDKPASANHQQVIVPSPRVRANWAAGSALLVSGIPLLFGVPIAAAGVLAVILIPAGSTWVYRMPAVIERLLDHRWRLLVFVLATLGGFGWAQAVFGNPLSTGFIVMFSIVFPVCQVLSQWAYEYLRNPSSR